MSKVKQINLEVGYPTVETAMTRMKNDLSTAKMSGCKGAILIHGYGSSGTGGAIKSAVSKRLGEAGYIGIIKDWVPGENWLNKKALFIGQCPALGDFNRLIDGNQGVTVVLLR